MQYPASNMRRLAQLHRIDPWQAQTGCKSPCCRGQQRPQLGRKRRALAPITRDAIGWRGDGTLRVSNTVTAVQQRTDLPPHGAGDVLMLVLDPGTASLWLGRNGVWHGDPASDPPAWTAAASAGFHPQVQGRNPGDGGSLRSLPDAFSHPVPPGVLPLGHRHPELSIRAAEAWTEHGGGTALTLAAAALYIERETP